MIATTGSGPIEWWCIFCDTIDGWMGLAEGSCQSSSWVDLGWMFTYNSRLESYEYIWQEERIHRLGGQVDCVLDFYFGFMSKLRVKSLIVLVRVWQGVWSSPWFSHW